MNVEEAVACKREVQIKLLGRRLRGKLHKGSLLANFYRGVLFCGLLPYQRVLVYKLFYKASLSLYIDPEKAFSSNQLTVVLPDP